MTPQLIKIKSAPNLVERVYVSRLDAISVGSMAPGVRVMQEDIAEQLAVSLQRVLQALRLLEKDGFVLNAPRRGVLVAPLDVNWLVHIYQVRSALDGLVARLAARTRCQKDAQLSSRGRAAARGTNIKTMMAADAAFQVAMYTASDNPLIAQSAQLQWQHIRRTMVQYRRCRPCVSQSGMNTQPLLKRSAKAMKTWLKP